MTLVYLLNGPNLNLLGTREPDTYGTTTLEQVHQAAVALGRTLGVTVRCEQSNHEGTLVDLIHQARAEGAAVVINAGGYTHTSVAIADALAMLDAPYVEVHISNVYAREAFRHHSYLSARAAAVIVGAGVHGYDLALRHVAHLAAS